METNNGTKHFQMNKITITDLLILTLTQIEMVNNLCIFFPKRNEKEKRARVRRNESLTQKQSESQKGVTRTNEIKTWWRTVLNDE